MSNAIGRAGGGDEGEVYAIKNEAGATFALKVYEPNKRGLQKSDILAREKANKSREFITVPLEVNREYGYTIYPLLDWPYVLKPNPAKLRAFKKDMKEALAEDGLGIKDSHEKNFMYDEQGRLWRVDLSSLYELK